MEAEVELDLGFAVSNLAVVKTKYFVQNVSFAKGGRVLTSQYLVHEVVWLGSSSAMLVSALTCFAVRNLSFRYPSSIMHLVSEHGLNM